MKECKIFISRELGHHWPELQLVSDVGLTNKGRAQSLREFAAIPPAERSRVQVVFVEEETEHGLCSLKTPQRLNDVEIRGLRTPREMFHFIIMLI